METNYITKLLLNNNYTKCDYKYYQSFLQIPNSKIYICNLYKEIHTFYLNK